MTTTFETAQVGDQVYDLCYGWCEIVSIHPNTSYPITTDKGTYTYDGKIQLDHKNKTLFWDEVIITPPPKPLPKLEVDTKVIVWDSEGGLPQKRYFSHFNDDNNIHVFIHGATSRTQDLTVEYLNWELAKE